MHSCWLRKWALVAAAVTATAVGACSSSDSAGTGTETTAPGDGDGDGDTSGDGTGTTTTGGGAGCPPECPNGTFCSVAGQCIDDGTCARDGDCDDGLECSDDGFCEIGSECGQSEIANVRVLPNMLILLDRSGSMSRDAGDDSRWNVAKAAIETVTQAFDADIRFGLATYSSCLAGGCSAGSIVTAIADSNASAINGFLADKIDDGSSDGTGTSGGNVRYLCDSGDPETSTGKSLNALVGEPSLSDGSRDNAVLLITDGEESGSCVDGGVNGPAGAANLLGQAVGVRTYVVGLGINSDTLDQIAAAGGTTESVSANNEAELIMALEDIAAAVLSCDIALSEVPPDPDELFVFFNDQTPAIENDPTNGWTYDAGTNTVTFNGSACDLIRSGAVTDIDVVFGCGGPVID